jgi:hypothetical protein
MVRSLNSSPRSNLATVSIDYTGQAGFRETSSVPHRFFFLNLTPMPPDSSSSVN